jgi:hypothetical protein
MAIILVAIGGYFVSEYRWLLIVIILMAIGGYSIVSHTWLFY